MEQYQHQWQQLCKNINTLFDTDINITEALYLIGVQELGKGFCKFSRQEKLDLIHIGNCEAMRTHGYWKKTGHDADNWPQYTKIKVSTTTTTQEQEALQKKGIIAYFDKLNNHS